VVKDIDDGKIDFFCQQKHIKKKTFRHKVETLAKHLRNTKKNTFFYKYEKKYLKKSKFQLFSHGFHNPQNQIELETLGPQPSSLH
jgi:hypothetical protein